MDLNALTLDPDPEFWPNLDPDPGLCYQFGKNVNISFGGGTKKDPLKKSIRK